MLTGCSIISIQTELSKFVPISEQSQVFYTKNASLKKAVFGSFMQGQNC